MASLKLGCHGNADKHAQSSSTSATFLENSSSFGGPRQLKLTRKAAKMKRRIQAMLIRMSHNFAVNCGDDGFCQKNYHPVFLSSVTSTSRRCHVMFLKHLYLTVPSFVGTTISLVAHSDKEY